MIIPLYEILWCIEQCRAHTAFCHVDQKYFFCKVLISYIETAGSTTTRLKSLREQYHFACACPRCAKLVTFYIKSFIIIAHVASFLDIWECAVFSLFGLTKVNSSLRGNLMISKKVQCWKATDVEMTDALVSCSVTLVCGSSFSSFID